MSVRQGSPSLHHSSQALTIVSSSRLSLPGRQAQERQCLSHRCCQEPPPGPPGLPERVDHHSWVFSGSLIPGVESHEWSVSLPRKQQGTRPKFSVLILALAEDAGQSTRDLTIVSRSPWSSASANDQTRRAPEQMIPGPIGTVIPGRRYLMLEGCRGSCQE
ncbi:hypothetical protein RRG08_047433 [Elysia crispata]|uniref:Uncharacterized protein n=1 Tax=Elysia crispata TaxID=231223 RepID=A0AAE0YVY0_9GAST|nr:hypothetical protein RRG08_047433 [Elysia crispata]